MDDDDSKKRKNRLHLDSLCNSRPTTTKRKKSLLSDHDESDTTEIVIDDGITSIISNTPCTSVMDRDCGNDIAPVVVDDDLLSMVPFELSYMILSYVGDYRNAKLVCRRWKSLVDDGIACGVLLSREEMALIELKPLGVRSLRMGGGLNCGWMGLESIPDSVGALTNLNVLDLSRNALVSIPDSIGSLTDLTELYLAGNELTSIPHTIGSLRNLKELWLSGNQLTIIPETARSLTNLTKLYLHQNQLSSVPDSIGALSKLRELSVRENRLSIIPDTIGSLTNLTYLNLSDQNSGVKFSRPPLPSTCTVYL